MTKIEHLSADQQIEAFYVALIGSAADSGGLAKWESKYTQLLAHHSGKVALEQVGSLIAHSSETTALYPFLNHMPFNPNSAATLGHVTTLVDNIYQNLLGHGPAVGDPLAAKLIKGFLHEKITIGEVVLRIGDSATGADAATLQNKLTVATDFTTATNAAGLGFGHPLPASYLAEAHAVVAATTSDPASVTTEQTAIANWILQAGGNTYTLTAGADVINDASGHGYDVVNGPLIIGPLGFQSQSLNVGDMINLTGPNNVANLTLGGAIAPFWPNGTTISGAQTINFTNVGNFLPFGNPFNNALIPGANITGMTTATDINSAGDIRIENLGTGGLPTLLQNVNMIDTGATTFKLEVASSQLNGTQTLAVGLDNAGVFGANTTTSLYAALTLGGEGAAVDGHLSVGPDIYGAAGYGTFNFTLAGNNAIELGANGSTSLTAITGTGAGSLLLDGYNSSGHDGMNVKTIDFSAVTGNVVITGYSAETGTGNGFLSDDSVLTSVKTGAGNDWVDISYLSTAQIALNGTTVNLGGGVNELVVDNGVATSGTAVTFFSNVQILGDGNASGTIDMANLPSAVNEIQLVGNGSQTGDLMIIDGTNGLTVDLGDAATWANSYNDTINSTTPGSNFTLNVSVGENNPNGGEHTFIGGQLSMNGWQIANLASVGGDGGTNVIDSGVLLDNTPGGSATLNITGDEALKIDNPLFPTSDVALAVVGNGSFVTDTNSQSVDIAGDTVAASIDAHASGGWVMEGADLWVTGLVIGDNITGSTASYNQLAGSLGNDIIKAGIDGDYIWTMGGADQISLPSTHLDTHIGLFDTFTGVGTDGMVWSSSADTITGGGAGDVVAQQGFWGLIPGLSGALDLTTAPTFGTSADQSVVSHFTTGAGGDNLVFSIKAWDSGGVNAGLTDASGGAVTTGNAIFESIGSGGVFGGPGNTTADVTVLTGVTFANAAALATALASGAQGYHVASAIPATAYTGDFLVAYQNAKGVVIADVNLVADGAAHAAGSLLSSEVASVHVSDMVQLTGVSLASLNADNIHFIA